MGLAPAFVFSLDRRALLAILAISVSVSYALVAGAATSGLKDAQSALAGYLQDTDELVTRADGAAFDAGSLGVDPVAALSVAATNNVTWATVRVGNDPVSNASHAIAGRSTPYHVGDVIDPDGLNVTVVAGQLPPGASSAWVVVSPAVFDRLDDATPDVVVAVADDIGPAARRTLETDGFVITDGPATRGFYTQGALQLVGAVRVTVLASTVVVGLLSSSLIGLELRARRRSFATLRMFAGRRIVQGLLAGRGVFLLVAGHALGLAITLGLLFVLGRTGASLSLPLGYAVLALTATMVGGLTGLAIPLVNATQRLEASDLGERRPVAWLPAPLRVTLTSWRSVVPLAASALVLAASLGVVFGTIDMPAQIFTADGADVIAATSGNPLRGSVAGFVGSHMYKLEDFDGSSPEIFAPTTIDRRPIMVRGVDWAALRSMEDVRLLSGRQPTGFGEAVLGERAAARLDAGPGDLLVVPAAYTKSIVPVRVVGIATAPGLLADEVLVDLDTGRALADLGPDDVNLVRFREVPEVAANRSGPLEAPSGLEVAGLGIVPANPVPLTTATAVVDLVNFDVTTRSRTLTVRVEGEPVADAHVQLEGRATATVEVPFRVPAGGALLVQVNPERTIDTAEAAYEVRAPNAVVVERPVTLTVLRADGSPAQGVRVNLTGQSATTDASGEATVVPGRVGRHVVEAAGPDGVGAREVLVVDPADLYRPRLLVRSVSGPTAIAGGAWSGSAFVDNVGGEAFSGMVTVPIDGQPANATRATIPSGATARVTITARLDPGVHVIGPDELDFRVRVGNLGTAGGGRGDGGSGGTGGDGGGGGGDGGSGGTTPTSNIDELLEARRTRGRPVTSEELDPTSAFLGDTVENLNAAITVVTLATLVHAGLIAVVAVQRDLEERAPTVGSLAAVGAGRGAVRRRVSVEYLLVGGTAAIVGTVLGLAGVTLAAQLGWLQGFGHALVPRAGLEFGARIAAAALATTLAASVLAAERVRAQTFTRLVTEGPTRSRRPALQTLLEAEP